MRPGTSEEVLHSCLPGRYRYMLPCACGSGQAVARRYSSELLQPRRRRRKPGLTHKMTAGIHGEGRYCHSGPSDDGGPQLLQELRDINERPEEMA